VRDLVRGVDQARGRYAAAMVGIERLKSSLAAIEVALQPAEDETVAARTKTADALAWVVVLEEEAGAARHEAEELQHRLNDLEDRHEAFLQAALGAVRVVRPEGALLTDRLESLPDNVREVVALSAHRGAMTALASVQLRSSMHLGQYKLGFSESASATTRRALMLDFSGAAAVAATEVDIDDILRNGVDPGLDSL